MTAETDLLPCPFCGSPAEIDKGGFGEVFAACSKCWCHMGGAWSTTESDAIAAWNRRAIAAKDAEIEALRAEVDEWKDVARCASEQQDSLFREARALSARADNLRAEVATWEGLHASEVQARQRWQARAERLAEALETCLEVEERPSIIEMARVALRDHDQEGK